MTNHVLKHDNKILQDLLSKVNELHDFNRCLAEHIEPAMAAHCHVVKFEQNCLFVIVDNGSWATQFRFHIPYLMNKLKAHPKLVHLNGIICKTRPPSTRSLVKEPDRPMARLSPATSENLLKTAHSIQNTMLKEILKKMAEYKD